MRPTTFLLGLLGLVFLIGCAGWSFTGEAPEVLVANIAPLDSTPFEQRLRLDLRVRNPNDHDLHVTGIDVRVDLNGKRFARGLGNKEFTVPRLSETMVSVETSTSTLDVVRQVLGFRTDQDVRYGISGVLHLNTGRLPFDNTGVLVERGELFGILSVK